MQKLLLNIEEVAAALGVGRRTAYALRSDDHSFPRPVPLAARVVKYRTADVLGYVEHLASRAPTAEPDQLRAGRDAYIKAGRRPKRGLRGGLQTPLPASPGAARVPAERLSATNTSESPDSGLFFFCDASRRCAKACRVALPLMQSKHDCETRKAYSGLFMCVVCPLHGS